MDDTIFAQFVGTLWKNVLQYVKKIVGGMVILLVLLKAIVYVRIVKEINMLLKVRIVHMVKLQFIIIKHLRCLIMHVKVYNK